jgi:uncharacterized protein YkwD
MKAVFVTLIIAFSYNTALSQWNENAEEYLRELMFEKINELRVKKRVSPLIADSILQKAAKFHSDYMIKSGKLTHIESSLKAKTPDKRVRMFDGNEFVYIGENVLCSRPQETQFTKTQLETLSIEMFESWVESKGHYKNMVDPEYQYTDFGFSLQKRTGVVFATQVFGKKGNLDRRRN